MKLKSVRAPIERLPLTGIDMWVHERVFYDVENLIQIRVWDFVWAPIMNQVKNET